MYAFMEVEGIIFGEHTELVVDPTEEKLKDDFTGVKRTFVPVHSIIRIDEVSKQETNKIVESDSGGHHPFPVTQPPRSDNS